MGDGMAEAVALFSYGTLQLPQVQLGTYGRFLDGAPDALQGYRLEPLGISDAQVVALSGAAVHQIALHTGNPDDLVSGTVFLLSPEELDATDRYEVASYERRRVQLASGREAWAYVAP